MEIDLDISNKPRSISFATLNSNFSKSGAKLVPLDLKKIREERLINKTSTPKYEKRNQSDTIFSLNSVEQQWKQYKSVKLAPEESKLIFNKDTRPKSAIRGPDDTSDLIKIAESTANLFTKKKTLETVKEVLPSKKANQKLNKTVCKGSATQRIAPHSGLINYLKSSKKDSGLVKPKLKPANHK